MSRTNCFKKYKFMIYKFWKINDKIIYSPDRKQCAGVNDGIHLSILVCTQNNVKRSGNKYYIMLFLSIMGEAEKPILLYLKLIKKIKS